MGGIQHFILSDCLSVLPFRGSSLLVTEAGGRGPSETEGNSDPQVVCSLGYGREKLSSRGLLGASLDVGLLTYLGRGDAGLQMLGTPSDPTAQPTREPMSWRLHHLSIKFSNLYHRVPRTVISPF